MRTTAVTFIFVFGLAITVIPILAQPPDVLWGRTFGGPIMNIGYCVQETDDGGFVFTGRFDDAEDDNRPDLWLVKTDFAGIEVWSQTFGGTDLEEGKCVQQSSDGGYIIVGYIKYFMTANWDVLLIKTDDNGSEIWSQTFGGIDLDEGAGVQETSDGGYIIVGRSASLGAGATDVWLIKTDAEGNELWNRTFGGIDQDDGYSVQQTSDGGYIITGKTESFGTGAADLWLIKTDADGNEMWDHTFGGVHSDVGYSVQQSTDGGYIITGKTRSYGAGATDVWLIKTDAEGNELWNRTFGGVHRDCGNCVRQTVDGSYIILGKTQSLGAGYIDVWLIKTDADGNTIWNQTYGGFFEDIGYCIQQTIDGGYIITGNTSSFGGNITDAFLLRLEGDETGIMEDITSIPTEYILDEVHPNPFNSITARLAQLFIRSTHLKNSLSSIRIRLPTRLITRSKPIASASAT